MLPSGVNKVQKGIVPKYKKAFVAFFLRVYRFVVMRATSDHKDTGTCETVHWLKDRW